MIREREVDTVGQQASRSQPSAEVRLGCPTLVLALQTLYTPTHFLKPAANACVEGFARYGTTVKGFWNRVKSLPSAKQHDLKNLAERASKIHGLDPRGPWQVEPTEAESLLVGSREQAVAWLQSVMDAAVAEHEVDTPLLVLIPQSAKVTTLACLEFCKQNGLTRQFVCDEFETCGTADHDAQCSFHINRRNANGNHFTCMRELVCMQAAASESDDDDDASDGIDDASSVASLQVTEHVTPAMQGAISPLDDGEDGDAVHTF